MIGCSLLRRPAWLGATCAAVALTCGCSGIRVQRASAPSLFAAWRASALTCCQPSPRTLQTLRTLALEGLYRSSPEEAAVRLHTEALRHPSPDLLFALAEINYLCGLKAEKKSADQAVPYFYLCAGYAYHYLFDIPTGTRARAAVEAEAFDPRFRLACDLYNAGLARCLAAAQRAGQLDPGRQLHLHTGDGQDCSLTVVHTGFAWQPEEFGPFLFCADYEVAGLPNHHRTYGLGVPLIGTRAPSAPRPAHAYYPPSVSFPVTAFFRFEGSLADLGERRAGRLELYNPLAVQAVQIAGRRVPLESDLTTPLAYFLSHTKLDETAYLGFIYPDSLGDKVGIHTLEPYQPGKVPVLFVHGLLSSPLTWAPVYNDLLADPVLRRRYQFWVYFYPTGNPYLATAADLRAALDRLRADLDPEQRDPALDEMVLVGHSMGGLISRLMTVDGGDDFWHLVSDAPLSGLKLESQTRDELSSTFYFHRQHGVRRVVFLGTPHHGSKLSPSLIGRLGARLAGLPKTVMDTAQDVIAENPDLGGIWRKKTLPNSVDLLAPGSPALEVLAQRPRPQDIHYHSVIGLLPPDALPLELRLGGSYTRMGDGVVPYASAHLDDVESELVVPADHYHVHHHPLAVLEVRRILLKHVREVDGRLGKKGVLTRRE
jgi:pimeloyl-ACP methyl ester carboxylesterase